MRGQVLAFSEEKKIGVVAAADGPHRLFHVNDWRGMAPPQLGMAVNFSIDEDGRARQVQLIGLPESAATTAESAQRLTQSTNPHTNAAE